MKNNERTIGIVGTGMIASSMAVLAAGHGFKTAVLARSQKSVDRCSGVVDGFFGQMVDKGKVSAEQAGRFKGYINYCFDYEGLKDSEIIFESAVEVLETKYEVYRAIEAHCPKVKAICSVSSSIVPAKLAGGGGAYDDRIIVTHPFNPPHLVPFFEICGSEGTADGVVDYAISLLEELDRKPVKLNKPTPGFIGNRLQFALWREALALVEEGICAPEAVDTCLEYSFCPRYTSIGIFEHFDNGGLELNAATCRNIWPILSTATEIPDSMKKLMEEGKMGARSELKQGFYDWNGVDMKAYAERVSAPYWNMFDWKLPEE
ncbi:MAG: 3-hydroxyacyl-CoA dehydrogenase family protein [Firmicutes bacterium]|nr:3-hydroxyacyl-CoA dehydrogenase family protein [Bacillota bacterium]MBR6236648.1 3-hydroxyacyl-CoA dehydrogenase family protein [Bacillota bacterium]